MEVSNNIDYSNTQILNGYYKFNNVNATSSNQPVSDTDTLFYIEIPATSQAFNPSKCRLEFSADVTATGDAANRNVVFSNISPVTRIEIKTSSGQTLQNMSTCAGFAKTLPDRLRNSDNSLSSLTNGRFIRVTDKAGTINIYDFFNGAVNSTAIADNAVIWADAAGKFTYNTLLSDLVGGFWSLNKDVMLNESLYVNLYLNNACLGVVVAATGAIVAPGYKNFQTTSFFIKVAYQQSNAINMAIKQNIFWEQGLNIAFPYVSNFSYNDGASASAHPVSISTRIYNMIGNRLRRIYLIANNWAFTATNLQAGYSELDSCSNVQFFIDSNLITQYDNLRFENLLNCKLSNKYWNNTLQSNNFFLPFYFYDQDKDSDNLNEGMPVNADTIISFICNNTGTSKVASYNIYAEGVKNIIISKNGVAVI